MIFGRRRHASVELRGAIFVFGGSDNIRSSELFQESRGGWERIPDLPYQGDAATACVFSDAIYLTAFYFDHLVRYLPQSRTYEF
jgi:hypothetical protein